MVQRRPPSGKEASIAQLEQLAANRIAFENVFPTIDCGRFPAKSVVGHRIVFEADIFCDGHDKIDAALRVRKVGSKRWQEVPMRLIENDRWRATFVFSEVGAHEFSLVAWRDLYGSWQAEVAKKQAAGVPIELELGEGALLVEQTLKQSKRLARTDVRALEDLVAKLKDAPSDAGAFTLLMTGETTELLRRVGLRVNLSELDKPLPLWIDREQAVFSSWYELMPRSMSFSMERHGTFDDVIEQLPYVSELGFDVLYFPPIHPIGRTNRKGPNNSLISGPDDPGSPYAIGSPEGGHDVIHPELGDFESFARLIKAAKEHGLEIALDFAIQCSPDHPWIKQHPHWFDWRPDGTIKYAENPPKKYEDIVNVHFYRDAKPSVWLALRDIVLFWIGHGVKIFRVDNPHTKPLPFWEWMISEVRTKHPDVIFLAEAFTRPKMMKRLAKVGFTQSYTYFTWRETKHDLTHYLSELTAGDMPFVMRPNFFVNTPDINPVPLQDGNPAGYRARMVLAASLSPSWGMYNGFEICEGTPVPGKEEYLDSEKYQLRVWDFDRPGHIKDDIKLLNQLRREHPALQQLEGLRFYTAWNDNILYYGKFTPDLTDFLLFAVNLDTSQPQGASIEVPLWEFGLSDDAVIDARDEVTGEDFQWAGKMHDVWLDPEARPYAIWSLKNPAFKTK